MLDLIISSQDNIVSHNIGDMITFKTMPEIDWLLIDITDDYYIFTDIWNLDSVWRSKKKAPVHKSSNILSKQSKSGG